MTSTVAHLPAVPRLRQEYCCGLEASLGYILISRPAWSRQSEIQPQQSDKIKLKSNKNKIKERTERIRLLAF